MEPSCTLAKLRLQDKLWSLSVQNISG